MERILVFRGGALGDFLLTAPIIAALRNVHHRNLITLVTRPTYGELMLAHGFVDDFKNIESAEWAGMYLSNLSLPRDWSAWLASYSKVFANPKKAHKLPFVMNSRAKWACSIGSKKAPVMRWWVNCPKRPCWPCRRPSMGRWGCPRLRGRDLQPLRWPTQQVCRPQRRQAPPPPPARRRPAAHAERWGFEGP